MATNSSVIYCDICYARCDDFVRLQTAEALPEITTAAASPGKKLIFPPDTSAIKEASLILMRDKNGSKPTLIRVSDQRDSA